VEIARHLKLMVTRGCFGHMARKRGAAGGWIAPNTFAAQKLQDVGKGKGWFSANAERGDFSGCVRLPLRVQADRIVEEEAEEEAAAAAESTARREEREQHAKAPRGLPILVGLRERSARMGANVFFTGDPQTMRDVGAALDFELFAARVRGDGCRRRTGVVDARPHPPLVQFLRLAPHQQDIIISTIIVVIMIIIKERSSQLRSREQPPF
jgi:hypothetical protein